MLFIYEFYVLKKRAIKTEGWEKEQEGEEQNCVQL